MAFPLILFGYTVMEEYMLAMFSLHNYITSKIIGVILRKLSIYFWKGNMTESQGWKLSWGEQLWS